MDVKMWSFKALTHPSSQLNYFRVWSIISPCIKGQKRTGCGSSLLPMDLKTVVVLECRPTFKVKSKMFPAHFIYPRPCQFCLSPIEVLKSLPAHHSCIRLDTQVFLWNLGLLITLIFTTLPWFPSFLVEVVWRSHFIIYEISKGSEAVLSKRKH